ncbi:hypothetical protein [Deinococcus sp. UR1]|uniref:hypothetical protein n=1 Tax=Deinococcus sp. UR1 TaxID=1704277 RepID=UPI0006DCFF75|nr:hypothetical protein [Deinococcus sp. UR1]PIG98297.1 hypothetical protein AMD26_009175 [Deinococcus sp. UR1]
MNIAFPVLLLTLVLLPGFLLRYGMLRGTYRRSPITAQTVTADLGSVTFFSALIHLFFGWATFTWGVAPKLDVLLPLLLGQFGKDSVLLTTILQDLGGRPWVYIGYFFGTSAAAYLLGLGLHDSMRRGTLARRLPLINDWHDLLSRDANRQPNPNGGPDLLPDVYITTVVDLKIKDQPVLVRGLVKDWFLTPAGDLDYIVLSRAFRRSLSAESPAGDPDPVTGVDSRYYDIRGDHFILRRSEMITLNVLHLYITDDSSSEPLPTLDASS